MTDPANFALVVLCHDDERKQVSIVYQFHSIETDLQLRHTYSQVVLMESVMVTADDRWNRSGKG